MPQSAEQPLPSNLYDEQYFLSACEGYEEFRQTQGEQLSRRLREAFAVAQIAPGMQVLDVGCGRGEILRHCAQLGARAYGVDYSTVAVRMARESAGYGVYRADAKRLPFPAGGLDRVLLFDIVEHLYPWELHQTLLEAYRVLKVSGKIIIHTAPNRWYDAYAYPLVRIVRTLQGRRYPHDPRALNVAVNQDVHVNEQDIVSLRLNLKRAGFRQIKVWLATPPQNRREDLVFRAARHILFNWIPMRWFFEREVFAVATREK
jgi:cyclopropane fatty-acyl-phospholipid synthase-like methyltransferase